MILRNLITFYLLTPDFVISNNIATAQASLSVETVCPLVIFFFIIHNSDLKNKHFLGKKINLGIKAHFKNNWKTLASLLETKPRSLYSIV